MTTWISGRTGQFTYFDRRLGCPDWTGRRVLDFGGNVGNLLLDENCKVRPQDYWSMDVSRDAIAEGQKRHPAAHFVFYDRYNFEYNPTGTRGLPVPDPGVRFDVIVAFGVITHNDKADTLELVDQLMSLLTEDGRLAFTFIDPQWTPPEGWTYASESADSDRRDTIVQLVNAVKPDAGDGLAFPAAEQTVGWTNMRWTLEKMGAFNSAIDVEREVARTESTSMNWVSLVDGTELLIDPDSSTAPWEDPRDPVDHRLWGYINLYTAEYMRTLFPNARILPPEDDRQHCAIIDARSGTGR